VYGLGGIGKSVLVTAFARDQEVRRAFQDGVFFIGFGAGADVDTLEERLACQFGVPSEVGCDQRYRMLRTLLQDRNALFILDDIRDVRHVERFIFPNRGCRTVVTTRGAELVRQLGGSALQMELPSEAESLAMLAEGTGVPIERLPAAAHDVAQECGHLPLALALCGAMVRTGQSWTDVRDRLRAAVSGDGPKRSISIMESMRLSYGQLLPEAQECLLDVTTFPKSDSFSESDIVGLWRRTRGMSKAKSRKVLSRLRDAGFINVKQTPTNDRRVLVHDLVHQFLREISGKTES
jgi:hypothetical protein